MNAAELLPWFNMASTVIAGLGIIVSTSLGIASLNANRRDRIEKVRPDLLFNVGGQQVSARLCSISYIPGFRQDDPEVKKYLSTLLAHQKGLSIEAFYGRLTNYGGPGLSIYTWFRPEKIVSDGKERHLTRREIKSAPYSREWNSIVTVPANLLEGESAYLGIFPTSVYIFNPAISSISGSMYVECRDKNGYSLKWKQPVVFFIVQNGESALISISFAPREL